MAAVFAYPLGLAVWISFHKYIFTAPGVSVPRPFVGLDNYAAMLDDDVFWRALGNNLVYALGTIPAAVALALAMALWVNGRLAGRATIGQLCLEPGHPDITWLRSSARSGCARR